MNPKPKWYDEVLYHISKGEFYISDVVWCNKADCNSCKLSFSRDINCSNIRSNVLLYLLENKLHPELFL